MGMQGMLLVAVIVPKSMQVRGDDENRCVKDIYRAKLR